MLREWLRQRMASEHYQSFHVDFCILLVYNRSPYFTETTSRGRLERTWPQEGASIGALNSHNGGENGHSSSRNPATGYNFGLSDPCRRRFHSRGSVETTGDRRYRSLRAYPGRSRRAGRIWDWFVDP